MEPIREVHDPWKELKIDINTKWETVLADQYTRPPVVPLLGTPQNIFRLEGTSESLARLLISKITLSFFKLVEKLTNNYSYKDGVVEKMATDWDGNLKTKNYIYHCPGYTD